VFVVDNWRTPTWVLSEWKRGLYWNHQSAWSTSTGVQNTSTGIVLESPSNNYGVMDQAYWVRIRKAGTGFWNTTMHNSIRRRSRTLQESPAHTFLYEVSQTSIRSVLLPGDVSLPNMVYCYLKRTTCPQELSKDHRDELSRRLESLQGLCHSPPSNTVAEHHPLSQRYRSQRRNHDLRGQLSQLSPGSIQELFTLQPNLLIPTRLSKAWEACCI